MILTLQETITMGKEKISFKSADWDMWSFPGGYLLGFSPFEDYTTQHSVKTLSTLSFEDSGVQKTLLIYKT